MSTVSLNRLCAVAGLIGGLLGLLLSPVVTAAAHLKWGADLPWEGNAPAWLNPFRTIIEPLLALPPSGEVYPTYGKTYFLVYLLIFVSALGLRPVLEGSAGRLGLAGIRLIQAGLLLNVFGNIADYWLGEPVLGQPWWGILFAAGTLLGYLIYLAGAIVLGITTLKRGGLPKWWAWLLMVTAVAGCFLPFWGVEHIPSGMVFALGLCWLLTGGLLLSRLPSQDPRSQLEPGRH